MTGVCFTFFIMQAHTERPKFIGAREAARILGRSVKTVHRYCEQGTLTPVERIGTGRGAARIFLEADIQALASKLNNLEAVS